MRLKTGSAVNQVTPMLIMHSLASRLGPGYSCSKSGATWMGVGWGRASGSCSLTDLPGNYFPAYYVTHGLSTPPPARPNRPERRAWPRPTSHEFGPRGRMDFVDTARRLSA